MTRNDEQFEKFHRHFKISDETLEATARWIKAHMEAHGPAAALRFAMMHGEMREFVGSPRSAVRKGFLRMLAALDADYEAAWREFERGERYEKVVMRDDDGEGEPT